MSGIANIEKQLVLRISEEQYIDIITYVTDALVPPKFRKNKMLFNIYQAKLEKISSQPTSIDLPTEPILKSFKNLAEQVDTLMKKLDKYHDINSQLQDENSKLKEEIKSLENKLVMKEENNKSATELTRKKHAAEITKLEQALETLHTQNEDLKKKVDKLFKTTFDNDNTIASLKATLEQKESKIKEYEIEIGNKRFSYDLVAQMIAKSQISLEKSTQRLSNHPSDDKKSQKKNEIVALEGVAQLVDIQSSNDARLDHQSIKRVNRLLAFLFDEKIVRHFLGHLDSRSFSKLTRLNRAFNYLSAHHPIFIARTYQLKERVLRSKLAETKEQLDFFALESAKHQDTLKKFFVYKTLYKRERASSIEQFESIIIDSIGQLKDSIDSAIDSSSKHIEDPVTDLFTGTFFSRLKTKIASFKPTDLVG